MKMTDYWPIIAWGLSAFGAWTGTLVLATWGIMKWLTGQFSSQEAKLVLGDAKRTEMKEAILLEVRETRHELRGRMDMQHSIADEKIDNVKDQLGELGSRVTRLEAHMENIERDVNGHRGYRASSQSSDRSET